MKYSILNIVRIALLTTIGVATVATIPVSAVAVAGGASGAAASTDATTTTTPKTTPTTVKSMPATPKTTATQSANDTAHVQRIINRGNTEIERRITSLNSLSGKLASAKKLTATEIAAFNSTIATNVSNLTTLKAKLDADTTVTEATTDAQSIILGYRIYALVLPQINMIKNADDQQVTEAKLATLATKLSTRISADQAAGKDVTALQAKLTDMNTQVTAAQGISSTIEGNVVGIQPTDYNTNHEVLSAYRTQLTTAHTDITTAISDAKTIITGLKNL